MTNQVVRIIRVNEIDEEVRALIFELDSVLSAEYSDEQRHGLNLDQLISPNMRFYKIYSGEAVAGCGGAALFEQFAEVKRMYVRPHFRSQGLADELMNHLERNVLDSGLGILRLETGSRQLAAIKFYLKRGFRECKAFEPYSNMKPEHIAESVFFEKDLSGIE